MADFFDTVLAPHILGTEGGYSNNAADRGGETIWGITIAVARENGYTGAMRSMSKIQALGIYRAKFWHKPDFDQIVTRSRKLAAALFDYGVNSGEGAPSKALQTALNAFNRQGRDYPDMTVDGSIGPTTLRALDTFIKVRGIRDAEIVLMRALEAQRGTLFLSISASRQPNEEFTFGWFLNRLTSTYPEV